MSLLQKFKYVTCKKCKWVHFEVSREFAESEVRKFNAFYVQLAPEVMVMYGNEPCSISQYEHCDICHSSYKTFRKALKKEVPVGSTIGPIINKKE